VFVFVFACVCDTACVCLCVCVCGWRLSKNFAAKCVLNWKSCSHCAVAFFLQKKMVEIHHANDGLSHNLPVSQVAETTFEIVLDLSLK